MPKRAARPCAAPGCSQLVRGRGGWCEAHKAQRTQVTDQRRGSAAGRGYDRRWRKLRLMYLRTHPLCVSCQADGITTQATEVDHIRRRRAGGGDEWDNLQALCKPCHSRKTAAEGRGDPISVGSDM
jgi:5-methylcytosine-specific restriction enzyme A